MKKVNFTEMKKGTKKDYILLDKLEKEYVGETADRILSFLSRMTSTLEGYKISRLEHSLQTATRAFNDKADEEMVVAALLHDIGDELAPLNILEAMNLEKTDPENWNLLTDLIPELKDKKKPRNAGFFSCG